MFANKGTVLVRGYIGYHFDGLLIQLLNALHPLVLFIAMLWLGVCVGGGGGGNRVYCIHVLGHDPLILSFLSFSFLIGWEFYGLFIESVKTCALGRQRPFSPSFPAEAGCLFAVAAGVHVFISGESLHCFLVGWCANEKFATLHPCFQPASLNSPTRSRTRRLWKRNNFD